MTRVRQAGTVPAARHEGRSPTGSPDPTQPPRALRDFHPIPSLARPHYSQLSVWNPRCETFATRLSSSDRRPFTTNMCLQACFGNLAGPGGGGAAPGGIEGRAKREKARWNILKRGG